MASIYILEQSIDVLYVATDKSGNITRSNELFKQYVSHIKPVEFNDLIVEADKDAIITAVEQARKLSPLPQRAYARTRQKTGAERYAVWNVYSIGDNLYFIGIQLYDISSVASHEHERLKALMSDVAFMAAHEVRQPLSSLLSLIDLMATATGVNEECTELLNMAQRSAKDLDGAVAALIKKLSRQL